tara:strand:+ start:712 stop:909 length:198 start_codon:yes stop_codon:yes gene_type:complete
MNKIQLSKLTYSELIRMYLGAQGDMTLVPGDTRRKVNQPLVRACFIELISRAKNKVPMWDRRKHE